MAFPGILLAIGIAAVRGPSFGNVLFALTVLGWVGYARVIRAQVLKIKTMEYVESARSVGSRPSRLLLAHILPNALSPVLVLVTLGVAGAIVPDLPVEESGPLADICRRELLVEIEGACELTTAPSGRS